jgi:hypothetical protein
MLRTIFFVALVPRRAQPVRRLDDPDRLDPHSGDRAR